MILILSRYKIVRVDQLENMIGKQMREKGSTKDKVIRREVTCILTAGTLVDRGLLIGDESVYCMSIKVRKQKDDCQSSMALKSDDRNMKRITSSNLASVFLMQQHLNSIYAKFQMINIEANWQHYSTRSNQES